MIGPRSVIGVLGAGAMGGGIAQVAAAAGHPVLLGDSRPEAVDQALNALRGRMDRDVEKGRRTREEADQILARVAAIKDYGEFAPVGLVIEAIVEDLDVKRQVFAALESAAPDAILATNTSSLSVTAIASACQRPDRVLGVHFFNPAFLLPLVEIVPGHATDQVLASQVRDLVDGWGKTTVMAQDTPGFIVNRLARPFYGESLRILEEGVADVATIDWAMREIGGFRMGPFELMDLIGNDVNHAVSESVFAAFYNDPRYRPSMLQRRMVAAGLLGRKTGRGWYDHAKGAAAPAPVEDRDLGQRIVDRVVVMLVNEAADALFLGIATRDDLDLAMTAGVNYPRGLLRWADDIGVPDVLARLDRLQAEYGDDRYRPSPLLRRMAAAGARFWS